MFILQAFSVNILVLCLPSWFFSWFSAFFSMNSALYYIKVFFFYFFFFYIVSNICMCFHKFLLITCIQNKIFITFSNVFINCLWIKLIKHYQLIIVCIRIDQYISSITNLICNCIIAERLFEYFKLSNN